MLILTGLYASLLGLFIIILALNVVKFRRTQKVGLGDSGHSSGMKAIRAHANTVEYVPMLFILMGIYEINGGVPWLIHLLGIFTVIGRLLHAKGLSQSSGVSFGRFYGTAITWLVIIILAVLNIVHFISQSI